MALTEFLALEVYGPTAYNSGWLVAGLLAVALLLGLPVLIVWFTRPRPTPPPPPPPPPDPEQFRHECLTRIAEVRRRHAAGELADRAAHQELSQVVRGFVSDATRLPVDRMVLSEVRHGLADDARFAPLADWIEVLYPPQFAPDVARSVAASADEAERLVRAWA